MNIKNFPMGSYLTNCYLVWDKEKMLHYLIAERERIRFFTWIFETK
nr:hypothetical protein [Cetobacterium sp. 2A]